MLFLTALGLHLWWGHPALVGWNNSVLLKAEFGSDSVVTVTCERQAPWHGAERCCTPAVTDLGPHALLHCPCVHWCSSSLQVQWAAEECRREILNPQGTEQTGKIPPTLGGRVGVDELSAVLSSVFQSKELGCCDELLLFFLSAEPIGKPWWVQPCLLSGWLGGPVLF